MAIPDWADPELTSDLPRLLRAGENQSVEFKQNIPKQASDLANEIAAFASSNDGLILLGVSDDGKVVGVEEAHNSTARDSIAIRIVGICQIVKPAVKPVLLWVYSDIGPILAIRVSRGKQPLYYANNRPYVRHASVSRPAEPDEVVDAIRAYVLEDSESDHAVARESDAMSKLAAVLVGTMLWCDVDSRIRQLNPWLDEWTTFAREAATRLRDLAADDFGTSYSLVSRLRAVALKLDRIANYMHTLGSGGSFEGECADARSACLDLFNSFIKPVRIDRKSTADTKRSVLKSVRLLADLWERAEASPFSGLVDEAQIQSGIHGRKLMEISYYPLEFLSPSAADDLRAIGASLFLLETKKMYGDGGASQREAIATAAQILKRLNALPFVATGE